ncbi:DUF5803 family protein [Methanolobus sp. ZRKC3]|uniref:DUF5803 family protein n=1 Tax=Methanolobus sp. ZRKC3 TaxID=3125786 RepID=UPI00324E423B
MEKRTKLLFCILMLSLFAGGCIDELVPVTDEQPMSDATAYEFEAFLDESFEDGELIPTSTFYLSGNEFAMAVYIVDNESSIDIVPLEDLSTSKEEPVSNVVILGDYSNRTDASKEYFIELSETIEPADINYTISEDVQRGQKHVFLNFEQPITGFVAFTVRTPMGQDYIHVTTPPSVVRFVIPEGFTTGNSLIGKVSPTADEVYLDSQNRENIVWYNDQESPKGLLKAFQDLSGTNSSEIPAVPRVISIKFYSESAPIGLGIAAFILVGAAAFVLLRFYAQKRKLVKIRSDIENQFISPKQKGKE